MTKEQAQAMVDAIREHCGDDEHAHSIEDELFEKVMRSIADGTCDDPRGLATVAMQAKGFDFARWCA